MVTTLTTAVPSMTRIPFQSPLFRCPTEVIIKILLFLPLDDLLALSKTCKKLQSIHQDSIELRYREELLVAGCRDRNLIEGLSPRETPLSKRLSLLEAQQARWKSLNWLDVSNWPLTEGCPIYELYGGTFAQIWDNIPEFGKRRSNLNIVHLPSQSRGIESLQKISHRNLGYGVVVELGIDPDQDLVMLIHQISLAENTQKTPLRDKFVIDFRTMNTDAAHPAGCGPIEYEPVHTSTDGRYRITPLIMGDLLGIMFNAMDGSPAALTIWRWTSGKQLMRLETPRPALWFSFLSETTFVVPCMDRDDGMTATLHIYRLPDEVLDPRNDARHTDSGPVILNPLPEAGYLLPPFNDKSITGYSLVCRSHPLPSPRAYVPPRPASADTNSDGVEAAAQAASPKPRLPDLPSFQIDPDERIMTFSFIFNVYHDDPMGHGIIAWQESHVLATHISTLLSHTKLPKEEIPGLPLDALLDLEALPFSLEPVTPPVITPWSAWADRARWLGDRTRRNWYSHTYGHRFVRPTWRQSEDHNDPFSIQVIDFNPYNIRRQAEREREFEAWRRQQQKSQLKDLDKEGLASAVLDDNLPDGAGNVETSTGEVDPAERLDQPLPEPQPSRPRIVTEASIIQGHVFTEPVKTSLPYMEVTSSEILYDFEGLMICEEHVLRLKRRSTSTSEIVLEIYSV